MADLDDKDILTFSMLYQWKRSSTETSFKIPLHNRLEGVQKVLKKYFKFTGNSVPNTLDDLITAIQNNDICVQKMICVVESVEKKFILSRIITTCFDNNLSVCKPIFLFVKLKNGQKELKAFASPKTKRFLLSSTIHFEDVDLLHIPCTHGNH